jgi:hypothetical protein
MRSLLITILIMNVYCAVAQVKISGVVKDETGQPVPFASVYIDDVFDGGSSETDGSYQIVSNVRGTYTIAASAIGFETSRQQIEISGGVMIVDFVLLSSVQVLDAVVISAGAFDASDKGKSQMLKPLDIVMNAGAEADIFKALETLPGVSKVGDQTGIFVRGGDAYETKTIIDGTLVQKPFFGDMPNMASRSRFDPFMFKGTTFTTGGYSAEYGGALSSVLLLDTQDIPEKTTNSLGVNMAGVNLSHRHVWNKKTAVIGEVVYNNLKLLLNAVPQNFNWKKEPESASANLAFRHKSEKGMFKTLFQHQQGKIALYQHNFENPASPDVFQSGNNTTYWNTSYKGAFGEKSDIYGGLAINRNTDNITVAGQHIRKTSSLYHVKATVATDVNSFASMKYGVETFVEGAGITVDGNDYQLDDHYTALYTEADITPGTKLAFRIGGRTEYSTLLNAFNVAPRTSVAYKTGTHSQVSFAWGHFFQKPENTYLFQEDLGYERASHLILNYQWITDGRSFRAEVYNKQYNALTKGTPGDALTNEGDGFSRGIDLFWKDAKTVRHLDYWVTYSFIDAERDFRHYPTSATPEFVTDHTFNIVANYAMDGIGLHPGLTYTFASGRRYYNPNNDTFLGDKTKAYHNLSFNISYVTTVFGNFAVLYGSLGNPFGFDQVFSYRYSPDAKERIAIGPPSKRTFFLGFFVNF